MSKSSFARAGAVALATVIACPVVSLAAEEGAAVEEIVVTARQREESLQDVPVTIAVVTEAELDRYNITTLTEASKMIPNFSIFHGGSGNGSNLILRGIGSSSISAAFDQSVAINIDGVVVNVGRFIHNAYMDMGQIEVLKGPQSLYFGKSATAGVVSITTKDPGDEFELEGMAAYEPEYDQTFWEGVISGPITETFGARFAIGRTTSDELFLNLANNNPDPVAHPYRGEEALNARLTLVWEPMDSLKARFKYSRSEYDNDGANGRTEEICPEGHVQPSAVPLTVLTFALYEGVDDCVLNGNTSIADLNPVLRTGLPYGGESGVPFLHQDTDFYSLQIDYDLNDQLALTSVSSYVDLEHKELDIYDYSAGVFGGLHRNVYEAYSQEFRLASDFDSPFNFLAGVYYQDVEQIFNAYQYAFNLALLAGPDQTTGNGYDYNKNHYLDTQVLSLFLAGYWDLTENVELTIGARYTDEEKDGYITIPYLHFAAPSFGFSAPSVVPGLEFDDDNVSPEVSINWHANDNVSLFASYRQGFKSGGIDNSALPTNSLDPAQNPDFPNFLIYKSEEAEGFEVGMKSLLADGALRFNATAFYYEYSDLQVQLFNSNIIQFETFNASELTTQGAEFDATYLTSIEGLSLKAAIAFTDTEFTDEFINAYGENLKGQDGPGSTPIAGILGASYDIPLGSGLRFNASLDARYNDGYSYSATLDPFKQSSFWITDAALSIYTEDERYQISFIGRNLGDNIIAQGAGPRPGACFQANPNNLPPPLGAGDGSGVCNGAAGPNDQDQVVTTTLGAEYMIQFRVRY